MVISTRTYPSTQTEVLDGNLITATTLPEDVVLVIDKAYKGPSNTVYNVSNVTDASLVFGANSPLIKNMQAALTGGAKNVALYRIGGQSASLENIFGIGSTITVAEASSVADANLKVYVGPEPLAPSRDAVIVYQNDRVVYSNVVGGEVDTGVVVIENFSKTENTHYVGSFYEPVPFRNVVNELGTRIIVSETDKSVITIPAYSEATASTYGLTVLVNGKRTVAYTRTGSEIKLNEALVDTLGSTYTVEVSYIKKLTVDEKEEQEIVYKAGEDLINASWKDYYEAFDKGLHELSIENSRSVLIGDLFNVPNIVDGSKETNRLEYVSVEENEDGELVHTWSTEKVIYQKDNTGFTSDVYEADLSANGEPIVLKQFNVADFTHRAGMWAYNITRTQGIFPNIVVGAVGPKAYAKKFVNQWLGRFPTFNMDGVLISNGTGLLGNRYMAGSLDYAGGYWATSTGHPDGTILTDSGGAPVDLGKYLSIVISQVVSNNVATSGAAAYAGVIANAVPGDGTTNSLVRGVSNLFKFSAGQLEDINDVGYVAFVDKTKGLSVLSGTLASRVTSDFQYVGEPIVMNEICKDINEICDPYLGKGIDGTLMVALHTALNTRFAERQKMGYFIGYTMVMSQIGPNTIKVRYRITAKDELRVISNEIIRGRSINTAVLGE